MTFARAALVCAALALGAVAPSAYAYVSPGAPRGFVNDFVGVLNTDEAAALEAKLGEYERATGNEVAVVTIPSLGGDYIEHYAVKLFEEWKVGKEGENNGLLLLVAIDDRKLRIEVGYGLEPRMPDSVASSIIEQVMVPKLREQDYAQAIIAGTDAILSVLGGGAPPTASQELAVEDLGSLIPLGFIAFWALGMLQVLASFLARSRAWWPGGLIGAGGAALIGLALSLSWGGVAFAAVVAGSFGALFDYLVSRLYKKAKDAGHSLPPWFGGGSGSSHSSGGGFGGFGGGRSGGGGASGGW